MHCLTNSRFKYIVCIQTNLQEWKMNIKDVVKVIQASECAQIATFGKDETEGFPEIRALLNLANPKKYPKLKDKAISVDGE